jgi:hypothetical protein
MSAQWCGTLVQRHMCEDKEAEKKLVALLMVRANYVSIF